MVEVLAAGLLVVGLADQAAAAVLIRVMLGALHRKIVTWEMTFWEEESNGWYYDLLYLVCNLVMLARGGGAPGVDALWT